MDVPRSISEEEDRLIFRKPLANVLKAISIVFPHIGYRSGMSFLVMRILKVVADEEATFEMMYRLLESDPILSKSMIM